MIELLALCAFFALGIFKMQYLDKKYPDKNKDDHNNH